MALITRDTTSGELQGARLKSLAKDVSRSLVDFSEAIEQVTRRNAKSSFKIGEYGRQSLQPEAKALQKQVHAVAKRAMGLRRSFDREMHYNPYRYFALAIGVSAAAGFLVTVITRRRAMSRS